MTATLASINNRSAPYVQRVPVTEDEWAPLALRLAAGLIFAAHVAQKLFGWFGGYGLEGTGQFFGSTGLNPDYLLALLVGVAEFFGGLALIVGLLVRPAAAALAFAMLVAIFAVHFSKGFFLDKGVYEYALALLAVSVSLMISGAGLVSVDRVLSAKSEWLSSRTRP
jgi:putative oxidoreductase